MKTFLDGLSVIDRLHPGVQNVLYHRQHHSDLLQALDLITAALASHPPPTANAITIIRRRSLDSYIGILFRILHPIFGVLELIVLVGVGSQFNSTDQ